MADYSQTQKIIDIKVNYSEAIQGIVNLRKEIEKLEEEQKRLSKVTPMGEGGIAAYKEAQHQMEVNRVALKNYKDELRILQKEEQNNLRQQEAKEGSLKQLRAELSNVTKAYDLLSREEREGARGKELAEHINTITTELKAAEAETQRYYRNVGNYENAIQNALGANSKWIQQLTMIKDITAGGLKQGLTMATQAVSAFGKQLLTLLANPIVATLAAIAAAVMAVSKAIKSSEQNTNAWNAIMAPFQRVLDGILNVIQNIVTAILSWVTNGAKLVGWIMTMMEKLPIVGKYLAMINGEIRESIALAQDEGKLAEIRRKNIVQNAQDEKEIARLRKEANEVQAKDQKKRMELLKQADALQKGIAQRNKEYAELDYKTYKAKIERTQSTAAELEELANKEAAMYQTEGAYYQSTMRIASGIASAEKSITSEREKAGQAAEETARKVAEAKKKELDAVRSAEDALVKLIKDEYERQRAEINISYERRIEDLRLRLAQEKDLTAKAREAILTEIKAQEELLQQELNKISIENLEKRVQQEQERLNYLLEVSKDDWLKRRELTLQQIDADEALQESRIAKEIQDEQKRSEVLTALHLAMAAKRQAVEMEFEKQYQDARIKTLSADYETKIREAGENELEVERLKVEEKLAILENSHQLEGESIEAWNERKLQMERDYQDQKKVLAKKEVEIETAKAKAIASAVGALSDLLEESAEDNRAMAMASKILALAEIAINSGVAIAAGIKQAQSVPYPANLAAIATTIATILTGITSAIKTVKSAKFAGGGYVQGAGTGTSDSINARLSNGESVMTANATTLFTPLLSALNQLGGGVPIVATTPQQQMGEDMLAAAVAKGMALAPRPVVAVTDIARAERRVEIIEDVATL